MILVRKWSEKASGLRREIFSVDFSRRVSKQKFALSLAFFWSRAAILIACHALFFFKIRFSSFVLQKFDS